MINKPIVPIIMYHALEDENMLACTSPSGEKVYTLNKTTFLQQMQYLHDNNFQAINLTTTTINDKIINKKYIVITFDDGHVSNYTIAFPILKQFNFSAIFFITTDWIGTPNYLTDEQIKLLHNAGMAIGSHGVTHSYLNDLDAQKVEGELKESRRVLSSIINFPVALFSAPGGRISNNIKKNALKLGYKYIFTSTIGKATLPADNLCMPRIAIKYNTSSRDFRKIVNLDHLLLTKLKIKAFIFDVAKIIAGNKRYEYLRELIIKMYY